MENFSLKLRPNFNAMKLLVVNALEEIGYKQLAVDLISNINKRNLLLYEIHKIKTLSARQFFADAEKITS